MTDLIQVKVQTLDDCVTAKVGIMAAKEIYDFLQSDKECKVMMTDGAGNMVAAINLKGLPNFQKIPSVKLN